VELLTVPVRLAGRALGARYESFGEDPALVVAMETIVDGQQGRSPSQLDDSDRVLSTAKHYAGDGDTEYDQATADANATKPWWEQRYTIDQGVTVTSRPDFERIDLAPFAAAVRRHDIGAVMPSFSSVDWTEDGVGNPVKMHAQRELITGTLKGRMASTASSSPTGKAYTRSPTRPTRPTAG